MVLAVLPGIILAFAIGIYAVNLPYLDEWQLAPFFIKLGQGTLTFGDLFALQNEYRQLFPNAIIVGLGWLTHWDTRVEMALSLVLAGFVAWGLWRLGRGTLPWVTRHWLLAPAMLMGMNLLIFSFTQNENWLFGEQFEYYMPIALLVAGLLIACSGLSTTVKIVLCMVLCSVSTFSMPNGTVLWLLLFPRRSLYLTEKKVGFRWALAWVALVGIEMACYLHGYQTPKHHPSPLLALYRPASALTYYFSFLSSPLLPVGPKATAFLPLTLTVGAVLVALFALAITVLLRRAKHGRRELLAQSAPWIALGGYSMLTAGQIMIGRVGFGPVQSLSSRYIAFSLYLTLALVWLGLLVIDSFTPQRAVAETEPPHGTRRAMLCLGGGFALLLLLVTGETFQSSIQEMYAKRRSLLYEKSCIWAINYLVPSKIAELTTRWGVRDVRQMVNALDRLDLLRPRVLKDPDLMKVAAEGGVPQSSNGYIILTDTTYGNKQGYGWAILTDQGEPAHAVALTYRDDGGHFHVFEVARVDQPRRDVEQRMHDPYFLYSGWGAGINARDIPTQPLQIDAWAIDINAGQVYRLEDYNRSDTPAQQTAPQPSPTP